MWVKNGDGSYYDTTAGSTLKITEDRTGEYRVEAWQAGNISASAVLQRGYATREDAQGALDEMMTEQEAVTIQPPTIPEESVDADDVDDEEEEI